MTDHESFMDEVPDKTVDQPMRLARDNVYYFQHVVFRVRIRYHTILARVQIRELIITR